MKQILLNPKNPVVSMLAKTLSMAILFVGINTGLSAQLSGSINNIVNATCFGGNDGAIDINVSGGTAPYNFSWSNGAASEDISGLTAGFYSVTITDAALASTILNVSVGQPPQLNLSFSVQDVTCNGGTDGSIDLTVSGGTGPYTYSWSSGHTSEDLDTMASGPYNVTVTDINGCNLTAWDTIGEPSLFFIFGSSTSPVSCFGGSDGGATLNLAGGILPYTFVWSNGATTKDLVNVPAGTYNVTASDNNGCKDVRTVVITEPASAVAASYSVTDATCVNSNDGAISMTVFGGIPPYSFLWNTGDTTVDLTGAAAGNYTLTITDANGCVHIENPVVNATDSIAPTAVCLALNLYLDASGNANLVGADLDGGSTDNCGIGSYSVDRSAFTCADAGVNTVELVVFDSNGNSDTCLASVTVIDTINPSMTLTAATIYLDATGQASLSVPQINGGIADACGIDSISLSQTSFSCADLGINNVEVTAVDVNGNSAAALASVTVVDTIAPTALTQNIAVYLDASGTVGILPSQVDNASSDLCGLDSMWLDRSSFTCADIGIQTVQLTVVDPSGNTTTANADVDVADSLAPQIALNTITVSLDATGWASIVAADIIASATDNCQLDTVILDRYDFSCVDVGSVVVQATASDIYGNTAQASVIITVEDTNQPLLFTQSASVSLDAQGIGQLQVADVLLTAVATCGIDTTYLDRYNFNCSDVGTTKVLVTTVSVNGQMFSDSAEVTVVDLVAPSMSAQNATIFLDASGNAILDVNLVDNGSSDACGIDTVYLDLVDFGCTQLGINPVILTAIDVNGNLADISANVTVFDTIRPWLTTQDITVYLDINGQVSIVPDDVVSASGDNCGFTVLNLDVSDFNCSDVGVNTVQVSILDFSGNAASSLVNVTVIDTVVPVVTARNINLYLDVTGSAFITAASVDDGSVTACGIDSFAVDRQLFDCSDIGPNTVVLTATKANGQSSSDTAIVTVIDTLSPQLIASSITVYLDNAGNADINAVSPATFVEEACGIDSIYFSRELFNCSDMGAIRVGVSIFDNNGNILSDSLNVNVLDTLAPNLTSQNITIYLDSTGMATITLADINTGAFDVCGMDTVYLDRYTFSCADAGLNQVNITGIDMNGAVGTATANVTVIDTSFPTAIARNRTIYVDASGIAYLNPADVDNGSFDGNCAVNLSLSHNQFDCSQLGLNLEQLFVTDAAGNLDSADFFVTVVDTMSPEVHLRNMTLSLDLNGQAWLNNAEMFDSASTDNCANVLSFNANQLQFNCSDVGTQTISVTVTDDKLNSTVASVQVTIIDGNLPQMVTQNTTVYLDANGQVTITPQDVDNGSSDACGIDSLWLSKSVFTGADLGGNTITLFGRDNSGLINSGITILTVADTTSPQLSTQTVDLYLDANGQAVLTGASAMMAASDNHGIDVFTASRTNFNCADLGINSVNIQAVDFSGNATSGSVNINVIDTLGPVLSGAVATLYLDASGNANVAVSDVNGSGTDNCGLASLSLNPTSFQCADVGTSSVMLIGTDVQGNTDSIMLAINILDTITPSISNIPADTIVFANDTSCGAFVNYPAPVVADNCGSFSLSSGSHPSGSFFPIGTTTVVFTLTDASGNIVNSSFNITVVDQSAPTVLQAPANDTIGSCQANYFYTPPVAVDNCSGTTVTQILGIPSGGFFPVGTTINAFKVSDDSGNDTIVSFYVVVEAIGQPTLPSVLTACENDATIDFTAGQSIQWSGKGMNANRFDPAQAGTGTHVLSYNYVDKNGCSSTGSVAITVMPKPNKPTITRIGSNTLTTGAFNTYQWFRDGVAIQGAITQNLTYTTGGNYQVMVSNVNACTNYSTGFVVGNDGGGIGLEESELVSFDVYPNPTSGLVTIDLQDEQKQQTTVRVFNITGQVVYQRDQNSGNQGQLTLDLSGLPKAAYMLQVTTDKGQAVRQIIIQ